MCQELRSIHGSPQEGFRVPLHPPISCTTCHVNQHPAATTRPPVQYVSGIYAKRSFFAWATGVEAALADMEKVRCNERSWL